MSFPLLQLGGFKLTDSYLLLVPLNLFGLALPVTQFLTFVPPTMLALDILERKGGSSLSNDDDTKTVLAYFVVLGFIQSIESIAPGVLARRIRKSAIHLLAS